MTSRRVANLLDKFANAEQDFLNREFLAPVVRGVKVNVRIDGVVFSMQIDPSDYEGWGVFRPTSHREAIFVREAALAERDGYLKLMTSRSFILCDRIGNRWESIPAHGSTDRTGTPIPVRLAENVQIFDSVRVGFDGFNGWYDRIDPRANSATAAWLRTCLQENVKPKNLVRKGLTSQQRTAYAMHFLTRAEIQKELERDVIESQIRDALGHAGAQFVNYVEHRGGYRVTFNIGSQQHVSSVDKKDLTLQTAGVCLNGEDQKFDLASLVGVLNEPDAQYYW